MRGVIGATLLALLLAASLWVVWVEMDAPSDLQVSADVAAFMSPGGEGFARAMGPRPLRFPDDHGPHPSFQTEWWYYTGNLRSETGRRLGFQLTFFRRALQAEATRVARETRWTTNQVYLAHFALTDVETDRHYSFERAGRGAVGLAGATSSPFRVWLDGWEVAELATSTAGGHASSTPDGLEAGVSLTAAADGIAIDLEAAPLKGVVLHGDRGYSPKGPEPGNASYYVTLPRLAVSGTVAIMSEQLVVEGLAWMDHEWSTSALGEGRVGWDWFAIQLDDGSELMLYQIRLGPESVVESGVEPESDRGPVDALTDSASGRAVADGVKAPESAGTVVYADGDSQVLAADEFSIEVTGWWVSPRTGARYPAGWELEVPSRDLALRVLPLVADQEMAVSVRYWEGAVAVNGTADGRAVSGHGYVELTGYAPTTTTTD